MNPDQDQQDLAVRAALRAQADYHRAPQDLRDAILLASARTPDPASAPAGARRPLRGRLAWYHPDRWRALAWPLATLAGFLFGCWLGPVNDLFAWRPAADPLVVALVAEHGHALRSDSAVSVRTSDSHTVKPWLSQHLGYSPVVSDLRAEGFPLIGARLAHLAGEDVAVLVYQFREHEIDVYVLRGTLAGKAAALRSGRDGYHLRTWTLGSLRYVALSDVHPQRLDELAQRLQVAAPAELD